MNKEAVFANKIKIILLLKTVVNVSKRKIVLDSENSKVLILTQLYEAY